MNHNVTTTDLKDTICSNCHCTDQRFLHHVWVDGGDQKFCTSCVLFTHKDLFCPTCFRLHDSPSEEELIPCRKCGSYSHAFCYSADGSPSGVPACSTCINPERLIFELKESKVKGAEEWRKEIDMEAARLLLTAAKIVNKTTVMVHDKAADSAWKRVTVTVDENESARTAVERCVEVEDGRVAKKMRLNEKYPSKNASI